jgi:hypothetical protein
MPVSENGLLEALESERLAVVVNRFDQSIAVEDETIARREVDVVLAERVAAANAQGKSPRGKRLELSGGRAIDVRIEMARG